MHKSHGCSLPPSRAAVIMAGGIGGSVAMTDGEDGGHRTGHRPGGSTRRTPEMRWRFVAWVLAPIVLGGVTSSSAMACDAGRRSAATGPHVGRAPLIIGDSTMIFAAPYLGRRGFQAARARLPPIQRRRRDAGRAPPERDAPVVPGPGPWGERAREPARHRARPAGHRATTRAGPRHAPQPLVFTSVDARRQTASSRSGAPAGLGGVQSGPCGLVRRRRTSRQRLGRTRIRGVRRPALES